jgi:hypothetical protein
MTIRGQEPGKLQSTTHPIRRFHKGFGARKLTGAYSPYKPRSNGMTPAFRFFAAILVLSAMSAQAADAQEVLPWPLRTSNEPQALDRGSASIFGNPARLGTGVSRGEAMAIDMRGPDEVEIDGISLGLVARLSARVSAGIGYAHLGLDDIPQTTVSPTSTDPTSPSIDVSEDRFLSAVAATVTPALTGGLLAGFVRESESLGGANSLVLGAGAALQPEWSGSPRLSAAIRLVSDRAYWLLGGDARVPLSALQPYEVRLGYGLEGSSRDVTRPMHRFAVTGKRGEIVRVTLSLDAQTSGGRTSWDPGAGVAARIGRYELGVVRENMSNGFGAVYYYRFSAGL